MTVHGTASPPWNLMELNMEPHGAPKLLGSRVNPNGFEIILRRQELKSFESQKLSRPEVRSGLVALGRLGRCWTVEAEMGNGRHLTASAARAPGQGPWSTCRRCFFGVLGGCGVLSAHYGDTPFRCVRL